MANNQRGYTLQSLIVLAVLVLLAVAAGVIIVAITRNSASDLDDQAADIEGICNGAEIHDTVLAATGAKGTNGNDAAGVPFEGSGAGCIPVCLWVTPPDSGDITINASELLFFRSVPEAIEYGQGNAKVYFFMTPVSFFNTQTGGNPIVIIEDNIGGYVFEDEIAAVRVNTNQEECNGYKANSEIVR